MLLLVFRRIKRRGSGIIHHMTRWIPSVTAAPQTWALSLRKPRGKLWEFEELQDGWLEPPDSPAGITARALFLSAQGLSKYSGCGWVELSWVEQPELEINQQQSNVTDFYYSLLPVGVSWMPLDLVFTGVHPINLAFFRAASTTGTPLKVLK